MKNNELYFTNETLDNRFEGFDLADDFDTDLTLDNVNPWLIIATYTSATVA